MAKNAWVDHDLNMTLLSRAVTQKITQLSRQMLQTEFSFGLLRTLGGASRQHRSHMLGRGRHASLGCRRRGGGKNNAYLASIRTVVFSHSETVSLPGHPGRIARCKRLSQRGLAGK